MEDISEKSIAKLRSTGLEFRRTKLGEASFVPIGTIDYVIKRLSPLDWTIAELRAIADVMEDHPKCSLFEDGSGKVCS